MGDMDKDNDKDKDNDNTRTLQLLRETWTARDRRALQTLGQVLQATSVESVYAHFPEVWASLVAGLQESSGASQSAKVLAILVEKSYQEGVLCDASAVSAKLYPLLLIPSTSTRQAVYETLVPILLPSIPNLLQALLETVASDNNDTLNTLTLARIGAQCTPSISALTDAQMANVIRPSLIHSDPATRFEAIRLLSLLPIGSSASLTRPISSNLLDLHRLFWTYNLHDSDSATVQTGLIGVWKDFLVRCRQSSYACRREIKRHVQRQLEDTTAHAENTKYLDNLLRFFTWWTDYAIDSLKIYKPYRCHVNALNYLLVLLNEGIDPAFISNDTVSGKSSRKQQTPKLWGITLHLSSNSDHQEGSSTTGTNLLTSRLLQIIKVSTYENVKQSAFEILRRCPLSRDAVDGLVPSALSSINGQRDSDMTSGILLFRLASEKMQKHDHNLKILLDELERSLQAAHLDFAQTASTGSIQGLFSAINRLIQDRPAIPSDASLRHTCERYLKAIQQIWTIIKPLLVREDAANASHDVACERVASGVEDDEEENARDGAVLSAAWRSLKDAADLLSTILTLTTGKTELMWSEQELSLYGRLFGTWLIQVDHRGAVAHISAAYGRLCSVLSKRPSLVQSLPRTWLEIHLTQVLDEHLTIKRRSAGLPYLILGVLAGSNTDDLSYAFGRLLHPLLDFQTTASEAAKSHALNTLRVLFQDGRLSTSVKPYIEKAFVAAVGGFGSPAWHVRNGSLLLYAALVQRLFGARKEEVAISRRPSFIDFFCQYPSLQTILCNELEARHSSTSVEALGSVFSILLLLSLLATPTGVSDTSFANQRFRELVGKCSASHVWKVREAAAAAMTGLVPPDQTWSTALKILDSSPLVKNENELHGLLLQVLHLVRTASSSAPSSFWDAAHSIAADILSSKHALSVHTATLHILLLRPGQLPRLKQSLLRSGEYPLSSPPGTASWRQARAQYMLRSNPNGHLQELLGGTSEGKLAALSHMLAVQPREVSEKTALRICKIAADASEDADVAIEAAGAYGRMPLIKSMPYDSLMARYQSTRSIPLKEALLPLLFRTTPYDPSSNDLLEASLNVNAKSESAEARLCACRTLEGVYHRRGPISVFHAYTLVCLMQDEDLEIRHLASRIASLYHGGVAAQSSKATELVWAYLQKTAIADDVRRLLGDLVAYTTSLINSSEEQAGVLFAVERSNVYIDPDINLFAVKDLLQTHAPACRSTYEKFSSILQQQRGQIEEATSSHVPMAAVALAEAAAGLRIIHEAFTA